MGLLSQNGIHYISQLAIGPYTVDIGFPERHVAVECDGTYWHALPAQRVVDRRKTTYLERHGWLLLRLTETRIRNRPADCLAEILGVLSAD